MHKVLSILLLIAAILSAGSAATLYKLLGDLPSPLSSFWRFQVTCLAEFPIFIHDLNYNRSDYKLLYTQYFYLPILSGLILSLFFLFFVTALELTSVARTVLLTNSVPIMMVIANYLIYKEVRKADIIGVCFGSLGLLLISDGMQSQNESFYGNCMAFAAAFCSCCYWLVGNLALKHKKLPLWGFVLTSNLYTGLFLSLQSGIMYKNWDILGWMSREYIVTVVILGLFPGVVGNVGFNYLMQQLRPVVVTCIINISPFVSIIIAWLAGFQGVPKVSTWIGGVSLIIGNITVTLSKQVESCKNKQKSEFTIENLDLEESEKLDKPLNMSINKELYEDISLDV
jgi:drug/metabolite transporter (DMT)-like permease